MIGKNQSVFDKEALMGTKPGKQIIKQKIFKSKGFKLFNRYKEEAESGFPDFARRFTADLLREMDSDPDPAATLRAFADEVGSQEMMLSASGIEKATTRLASPEEMGKRVGRILDSNFVKMTFPVFNALFDGAAAVAESGSAYDSSHNNNNNNDGRRELRQNVVEGHILAIDLSEPMDRIIDKDEDLEYLDDYRLMNPYILRLARRRISMAGDAVLNSFEKGFADARWGQDADEQMKSDPAAITGEQMELSYKKYRAVMGTAGRNMALAERPLGDIFYLGMAKAAEGVGCGNEMEDSVRDKAIKRPSWPLYYSLLSGSSRVGFDATLAKAGLYMEDARLAVGLLPEEFPNTPLLELLFVTMDHYNQYWYGQLQQINAWSELDASLPEMQP